MAMKFPDPQPGGASDAGPAPTSRFSQRSAESEYGRSISTNAPGALGVGVSPWGAPYAFTGAEMAFLSPLSSRLADTQRRSIAVDTSATWASQPDGLSSADLDPMQVIRPSFDEAGELLMQQPTALHRVAWSFWYKTSSSSVGDAAADIVWSLAPGMKPINPKQSPVATGAEAVTTDDDLSIAEHVLHRSTYNASSSVGASTASASSPFLPRRPSGLSDSSEEVSEPRDTLDSSTNSTLDASSMLGVETIVYTGGADANLVGNAEDNTLLGSTGNDTLVGAGGDDLLLGGLGNDVFVFGEADGSDRVIDFATGDRLQLIGLRNLDQVSVTETAAGQQLRFGTTVIELVGVTGLVPGDDWIISR